LTLSGSAGANVLGSSLAARSPFSATLQLPDLVQELGHADPRMTSKYAHVVDMATKNPALFIPVKVG